MGSGITWDTPSGAVNATDWGSTPSYGPTGDAYTPIAAVDVKAKAIATAGAGANLAR